MASKKSSIPANSIWTLLIAGCALAFFVWLDRDEDPSKSQVKGQSELGLSKGESHSTTLKTTKTPQSTDSKLTENKSSLPLPPVNSEGAPLPDDLPAVGKLDNPELPPDLAAQLEAGPLELPDDLKRQLSAPPPELPPEMKAQLEGPPPPIPDDIKRALATPPRIVTIDEVNSPKNRQ